MTLAVINPSKRQHVSFGGLVSKQMTGVVMEWLEKGKERHSKSCSYSPTPAQSHQTVRRRKNNNTCYLTRLLFCSYHFEI